MKETNNPTFGIFEDNIFDNWYPVPGFIFARNDISVSSEVLVPRINNHVMALAINPVDQGSITNNGLDTGHLTGRHWGSTKIQVPNLNKYCEYLSTYFKKNYTPGFFCCFGSSTCELCELVGFGEEHLAGQNSKIVLYLPGECPSMESVSLISFMIKNPCGVTFVTLSPELLRISLILSKRVSVKLSAANSERNPGRSSSWCRTDAVVRIIGIVACT